MNKSEAWCAIERLRAVQLTLNGVFPGEFWEQQNRRSGKMKLPSCSGIDKSAKELKDYIVASNDADFARVVNDMVYGGDQKDNLCNLLNSMAFYSDSPNEGLAKEMRDAAKYLLDICGWLVVTVYKVPFRETNKYVIRGDELVDVKEEKQLVFPKELKTPKAKELLYMAHRAGLLVITPTEVKWNGSKSLLAYFAAKCSKILKLGKSSRQKGGKYVPTVSYAPFEKMFNCTNLKQARYDAESRDGNPDGFKTVNVITGKCI